MEQDRAHRHQRYADDQDQLVQGAHHFGFSCFGVRFRFLRKSGGEGILPHCRQLHPSPACQYHGARLDGVAFGFFHRVSLAGDQGFVHPQLPAAEDTVGADLISLGKFRDVIPDDLFGRDLLLFPIPNDRHGPGGTQRQLIHGPLGPDLLHDTNNGIDDGHHQKAHIHDRRAPHDQHGCQDHEDQVEEGKAVGQYDLLFGLAGRLRSTRGGPLGDLL